MKCLLFSLQINDRWIILQILTLDHQILFWTIKKKKDCDYFISLVFILSVNVLSIFLKL